MKNCKQITRIGVYGVAMQDEKLLLIRQNCGPHAGKLDFPGGGIEFGESVEQTLRREFEEEVAMGFNSFAFLHNLTATIDLPKSPSQEPYSFFQIGMIYQVKDLILLKDRIPEDLEKVWIDPLSLNEHQCSTLLWKYRLTF